MSVSDLAFPCGPCKLADSGKHLCSFALCVCVRVCAPVCPVLRGMSCQQQVTVRVVLCCLCPVELPGLGKATLLYKHCEAACLEACWRCSIAGVVHWHVTPMWYNKTGKGERNMVCSLHVFTPSCLMCLQVCDTEKCAHQHSVRVPGLLQC